MSTHTIWIAVLEDTFDTGIEVFVAATEDEARRLALIDAVTNEPTYEDQHATAQAMSLTELQAFPLTDWIVTLFERTIPTSEPLKGQVRTMDNDTAAAFMTALDNGSNVFGALSSGVRARLYAVAADPTQQTWDDAHGIILRRDDMVTLWQACRAAGYAVDRKPADGPWPSLPTQEQIITAITETVTVSHADGIGLVSEQPVVYGEFTFTARRNAHTEPDGSYRWQIFEASSPSVVGYVQTHACPLRDGEIQLVPFDSSNKPLTVPKAGTDDLCVPSYMSCLSGLRLFLLGLR